MTEKPTMFLKNNTYKQTAQDFGCKRKLLQADCKYKYEVATGATLFYA